MPNLLFTFLLLSSVLCTDNFKKVTSISKTRDWVPLGKFSSAVGHVNIRARVVSSSRPEATEKADLSIFTYAPSKWPLALKAENCTNRLEQQTEQVILQVPLDGSWSILRPLSIVEGMIYVVATDCYGVYVSHFMGNPTEFEIIGGTHVPFSEGELTMGSQFSQTTSGTGKWRQELGISHFALGSFGMLLLFVIVTQILFKALTNRAFTFGFPGLLVAVLARIALHLVLLTDTYLQSSFLYMLAELFDLIAQIAFSAHCILVLLNWPATNNTNLIVHSVVLGILYFLLLNGAGPMGTIVLRTLMTLQLIVCFVLGRKDSNARPLSMSFLTFAVGLVFMLSFVAQGLAMAMCTDSSDITLSRVEVLVASSLCPVASYWIMVADFAAHSFLFGFTLLFTAHFAK